jgi:plasmid stabilization system protein ParE
LYEFLAPLEQAGRCIDCQSLTAAPAKLLAQPRIGEKLDEFEPREVRRVFVGHYEMRYEIQHSTIYVLRFWHTREER